MEDGHVGALAGDLISTSVDELLDRVVVNLAGGDDAVLQEFTEMFGTDVVCLHVIEPREPTPDGKAVTALAKVEGWPLPEGTDPSSPPEWTSSALARLEIAPDRATADRAWEDIVPDDLTPPPYELDHPSAPGIYGSLDDVDFDTHVVGIWRDGESGSCPGWLGSLTTEDDGAVRYQHRVVGAGFCDDNYRPLTMIVALDRDQIPDLSELPAKLRDGWENSDEPGLRDGDEVVLYPSGD